MATDWREIIEREERRNWIVEPFLFWLPYLAYGALLTIALELLRGHGPAWAWMLFGFVIALGQGAAKLIAKRGKR
jgi:hypothetical protein